MTASRVPFAVRVTWLMRCCQSDCPTEATFESWISAGDEIPLPYRPSGWSVLNGRLICDQHDLTIEDKKPK